MRRGNRRKAAPASVALAPTLLAPVLDLKEAAPLAGLLLARRGAPLLLDGSAVERLGGQCLQVLMAAQATWEADGQPFGVLSASPSLLAALGAFGAPGLVTPPAAGESTP